MGQTDYGAQLEAYARLLRAAEEIDPKHELEAKEGFREIFSAGLDKALVTVLEDTANHFEVLKGVFRAFAEFDPKRALAIATQMNTVSRRDAACFFIAMNVIQHGAKPVSVQLLLTCIDQIIDEETRADTLKEICRNLAKYTPALDIVPRKLIELCLGHHPGETKANLLISAITINEHYKAGFDVDSLLSNFHDLVCTLDPIWQRRILGYRMVAVLKIVGVSQAEAYFDKFCKAEESFGVVSSNLATSRQLLVRLSIVAWASLLKKRMDNDEELIRLRNLIADIPSFDIQASLYADMCERAWIKQRPDLLDKVCQKWVLPLIEALRNDDIDIYYNAMSNLFAVLYLWRQPLALDCLRIIPRDRKDRAVIDAVTLIITKRPLMEDFSDHEFKSVSLTYDEALLVVDLLTHVDTDSDLSGGIENLCKALKSSKSLQKISDVQRAEIAVKLFGIVELKLPDPRNIKHDGWKLLCSAKIEHLKNPKSVDWENYLRRAKAISNCADRVFILAELANGFPVKRRDLANEAFQIARTDLLKIPAAVDRIYRAISISKGSYEDAKKAAESLLKQAIIETLNHPDSDMASRARREVIDAASQIDEHLAKRLVEIIDDDPARKSARRESAKQLQIMDARKAVIDANHDFSVKQGEHLAVACWEALGSLNAGRCAPSKPSELSNLIEFAKSSGIKNAFPIFLWYLRNLELKFEATIDSERTLKPQLEVLLLVSEFSNRIERRLCDKECWQQPHQSGSGNMLISPTDREEAIEHICCLVESFDGDELLLCDPYFGPEDLELIQKIHFRRGDLKYTILISPNSDVRGQDLRNVFLAAWRNIADTQAPPIRIVIVMFKGTHKGPIHDRWLLGGNDGVRIGTSMNGLGASRWSEISTMERGDTAIVREELLRFARLQEWFANGVQVSYEVANVE